MWTIEKQGKKGRSRGNIGTRRQLDDQERPQSHLTELLAQLGQWSA